MKTDSSEPTGFLQRIAAAITHNWWLKLISLALAIIIYHSLKTGNTSTDSNTDDRQLFHYR